MTPAPSYDSSTTAGKDQPEFFQVKLKKAPKPRDYECPHNSGEGQTLLKQLQSEDASTPVTNVAVMAALNQATKEHEEIKEAEQEEQGQDATQDENGAEEELENNAQEESAELQEEEVYENEAEADYGEEADQHEQQQEEEIDQEE